MSIMVADVPGARLRSVCSWLGLVLSAYAVYVEWKTHHQQDHPLEELEEFTALCDVNAIGASCRYVPLYCTVNNSLSWLCQIQSNYCTYWTLRPLPVNQQQSVSTATRTNAVLLWNYP
jgi:hypothetical protein